MIDHRACFLLAAGLVLASVSCNQIAGIEARPLAGGDAAAGAAGTVADAAAGSAGGGQGGAAGTAGLGGQTNAPDGGLSNDDGPLSLDTPASGCVNEWPLEPVLNTGIPTGQSAGSTGEQGITGIARDAVGNYFVTGLFEGSFAFGTKQITSKGGYDFFVAKFDPTLAPVWVLGFGGPGDEGAFSVAADVDGNAVVAGRYENTVTFAPGWIATSKGSTDAFVLKLDGTGQVQWVKSYGGINSDDARAIAMRSDREFYVTGAIASAESFGGGQTLTPRGTDAFVARLAANGDTRWAGLMGGSSFDEPLGIASFPEGVAIVGSFRHIMDSTLPADATCLPIKANGSPVESTSDAFAVVLNDQGRCQWRFALGGEGDDAAYAVAIDANKSLFMTGTFFKDAANTGLVGDTQSFDGYVARIDAGALVWATRFGGDSGEDLGNVLSIAPGGDVILGASVGGTASFGPWPLRKALAADDANLVLARLDPCKGIPRWLYQADGDTRPLSLVVDDKGITVAGLLFDTWKVGSMTLRYAGGAGDALLLRFSPL